MKYRIGRLLGARRQYKIPPVIVVGIAVLVIETVGRWLLAATLGLWIQPTGAVVTIGAILFGPVVAPGVFVGTLVAGLLTSGTVPALASAAAVATGVLLGGVAAAEFGPKRTTNLRSWLLRYVFVASCAVCIVAATDGMLADTLGVAPFQLEAGRFLTTNLSLALVITPVAWYATRRTANDEPPRGVDSRGLREPGDESLLNTRRRAALFGTASIGWVLAGYIVGFVFRATERVPAERIGDRLVPAAARVLELVGPRGIVVQVVLGGVALAVLFVSVGGVSFVQHRR